MANAEAAAVTPRRAAAYDRVAQAVHWFVAVLVVGVVLLGWMIGGTPRNTPQRDFVVLVHESVGLTILAAMVFRAAWRRRHPPPPLPPVLAPLEAGLARFTHLALYTFLFVMPLAGYLSVAAAGHAVDLFRILTIPALLPENDRLSQWAIAVHLAGQYPLYLFVALHVAGALFHGAIRRDGILERMLPMRLSE